MSDNNYNHPYRSPRDGDGPSAHRTDAMGESLRSREDDRAKGQYRKGDAPFQFPWWAIVLGFLTWWPLGFIFIFLNRSMKEGYLSGFTGTGAKTDAKPTPARPAAAPRLNTRPLYSAPASASASTQDKDKKTEAIMTIVGVALAAVGLLALPEGLSTLSTVFAAGDGNLGLMLEDLMPALVFLGSGIGCLFGAGKQRTNRRLRKKIDNIVGDSKYMFIQDIAGAIPCSYEKCCKHLENCIDAGVFGENAYLDMRTKCLVIDGPAPPATATQSAPKKTTEKQAAPAPDKYQQLLDELHKVNNAIPGEVMTDKIARLESVSAKIFAQAKADPTKLPRMRKFMDYYLPTSLKLLKTYAELEAQGVEGENITESKRRIEQTMDTLVVAFENQLDQLFSNDAMDVSADIDVMQNMLRADGLTGSDPFKAKSAPAAPESPHLEL